MNSLSPRIHHPHILRTDLLCDQCGYNMRTLNCFACCPECGVPIVETVSHQLRFPVRMRRPVANCLIAIAGSFVMTAGIISSALIVGVFDLASAMPALVIALAVEHAVRVIAIMRLTDYIFIPTVARDDPDRLRRAVFWEFTLFAAFVVALLVAFCGIDFNTYMVAAVSLICGGYVASRGFVSLYLGRLTHDFRTAIDQPGLLGSLTGSITCAFALLLSASLAFLGIAALSANMDATVVDGFLNMFGFLGAILTTCTAIILFKAAACLTSDNPPPFTPDHSESDDQFAQLTENIALNPHNADAYFARGLAWQAQRAWDRAIADFTKAIQLDPENADAYYERGIARHATGDVDGKSADFDRSTTLKLHALLGNYRPNRHL